MIAALQELVVPVLRKKGFGGSFPHFRRTTDTGMDLLSFQFYSRGRSFVVEVAACTNEEIAKHSWKVPANRMNVFFLHPDLRLRLGSTEKSPDHWFKFDGRLSLNPYKQAAKAVLPYLDTQAEEWWNRPQEKMKPIGPV